MDDLPTIVAVVRDLTFIGLLAAVPLLGFMAYRKGVAFVRSVERTRESLEGAASTLSKGFVRPAGDGSKATDEGSRLSPVAWFRRKKQGRSAPRDHGA